MCRKELDLHRNLKKKTKKKLKKKVKQAKPCPAQLFFLMHEDVLN